MSSPDPSVEPALAPPAGVTPNFDQPPNESVTIIAVLSVYLVLTTGFTVARMFTRLQVHQEVWWDDWMMVVAWVGMVGLAACQFLQLNFGGGVDIWNVSKADFARFENLFAIIEIVTRLSVFFAKFSILLLYLRIFFPIGTQRTQLWWWIWGVVVFNLLYTIALILVVTLQCVPQGLPIGSVCVDEYLVLVTASVINVISDVAVLVIPIVAVVRLQMNRRKKIGRSLVFAFGALAPLSSIARLGYQIPQSGNSNRTIFLVNVNILSFTELVIAVIVGSVPVISIWFYRLQHARRMRNELARRVSSRLRKRREAGPALAMHAITRRSRLSDPYPMLDVDDIEGDYEHVESGKDDSDENSITSPAPAHGAWSRGSDQRDSGILTIEVEPRPKTIADSNGRR